MPSYPYNSEVSIKLLYSLYVSDLQSTAIRLINHFATSIVHPMAPPAPQQCTTVNSPLYALIHNVYINQIYATGDLAIVPFEAIKELYVKLITATFILHGSERNLRNAAHSLSTEGVQSPKSMCRASVDVSVTSAVSSFAALAAMRLARYCRWAYLLNRRFAINRVAIVRGAKRTAAARDVMPPRRQSAHV